MTTLWSLPKGRCEVFSRCTAIRARSEGRQARKPPRKEPAGRRAGGAVYGDLSGQQLGQMRWRAETRARPDIRNLIFQGELSVSLKNRVARLEDAAGMAGEIWPASSS